MQPRRALATLGLAALVLATCGCATPRAEEPPALCVDDAAISVAVRSRFIDNKIVDSRSIVVETMYGTVLLSGMVSSPRERETAEMLSRQVAGVRSVRNEITVRP